MIRAVIYARFSTELQNEKSVDDQLDLCRAYAKREGWDVIGEFSDKAISGATLHRPGMQDMLGVLSSVKVDVVLCEELDRLSRDMGDLANLHRQLTFQNIQLWSVHSGPAKTLDVGMRGLFDQLFREDNVHKVRRGMSGLVKQGLSAGGKAYGYRPDPANAGKPQIVEEEARIVREIFEDYAAGKSPKAIARALNERHVPAPRGKLWAPSAMHGFEQRGTGMLRNSIYVGRIVWNKVRMVKDPATGKRVSRPNPPEDWLSVDVPELRIIPDDLFEAVQAQMTGRAAAARGKSLGSQKRPKRLLSGLLKCGSCGSGMSAMGQDKSGRTRLRCSAHVNSGSCPTPKTFYLDAVEALVLESLSHNLNDPEALAVYAQAYQEERRRLNGKKIGRKTEIESRIAFLDKDNDRLLDWALREVGEPERLLAKMKEQAEEAKALKLELAGLEEPEVLIDLHPVALKRYANATLEVRRLLETKGIDADGEAAQLVRQLLTRITVYPNEGSPKGVKVKVEGSFSAFMALPDQALKVAVGQGIVPLVAEEGLEPPTRGL